MAEEVPGASTRLATTVSRCRRNTPRTRDPSPGVAQYPREWSLSPRMTANSGRLRGARRGTAGGAGRRARREPRQVQRWPRGTGGVCGARSVPHSLSHHGGDGGVSVRRARRSRGRRRVRRRARRRRRRRRRPDSREQGWKKVVGSFCCLRRRGLAECVRGRRGRRWRLRRRWRRTRRRRRRRIRRLRRRRRRGRRRQRREEERLQSLRCILTLVLGKRSVQVVLGRRVRDASGREERSEASREIVWLGRDGRDLCVQRARGRRGCRVPRLPRVVALVSEQERREFRLEGRGDTRPTGTRVVVEVRRVVRRGVPQRAARHREGR